MQSCLIFPKLVTIGRLDTAATKLTTPGTNTAFRSMRVANPNDGAPRETPQKYASVTLEAQVETGQDRNARSTPLGNSPNSTMRCVFDRQNMIDVGLIHATTGDSLLKEGDRLESITELDGTSLWTPRHGHAQYLRITMGEQTDFGFRAGASTVVLHIEERPTGP